MMSKLNSWAVAIVLVINGFGTQAQSIPFSKNDFKDSLSIALHMPELARQTIAACKVTTTPEYKDNLFRLHLVAKNYPAILPLLQQVGQEVYGDSIGYRDLGFAFRVYANSVQNATKANFNSTFETQFYKVYNTLSDTGKNYAEQFYAKPIPQIKKDFEDKLTAAQAKSTLEVSEAINLCRSYCSYLTYSTSQEKALSLFKIISDQKYTIENDILLPMPDGGSIAVCVVRSKKQTGPLPAVMMYTIYAGNEISRCKEIADNGFVGIVANTRGKRLSPDAIEPFEHDANDSYALIDWISKQPWCNGKVGMFGGSYLGFSQWSAMKKKHPALKTIVPQVAVAPGVDYPAWNGIFMSFMLRWIHFVANNKLTDAVEFENQEYWNSVFERYYASGKSFRELDALEGHPSPLFQRWLNHPTYDAYWQNMTPQKEAFSVIDIPILSTTGYYDDEQSGALYYFNQYQKWNLNNNYYLVIGPYDHHGAQRYPLGQLNDYKIDNAANFPIIDLVFQWFNYTLKGGPKPELLQDKVNFEVMGANTWKHVPTLDQMHNQMLTFYLSPQAKNTGYSLVSVPIQKETFLPLTVDFKDRSTRNPMSEDSYCGFDKIQPEHLTPNKNQLVFESEPLSEPMILSGALKASLVLETNKKDMDIVISLYEKTPDGHYFALTNSIQRASLTKDRSQRQLLKPNTKTTIPIDRSFITCKQLQKGSCIVVAVGVNKDQNWQLNYGTGKDVSDETIEDAAVPMKVKWYSGSSIAIPVLKSGL